MFYDGQMGFLRDIFKKCRVHTAVISKGEIGEVVKDFRLEPVFGEIPFGDNNLNRMLSELSPRTVYRFTDTFGFCYIYFLLPSSDRATLLLIGPYLNTAPSPQELLEIGEKNGISPKQQKYLEEYFSSVPVLGKENHLFIMLDTFCELIWKSPSFDIVDVNGPAHTSKVSISDSAYGGEQGDVLVNMKTMETRYELENQMMRAVSLGQLHMEKHMLSAFSAQAFEKRVSDLSRNAKNYCIIMNTLLRKAAENGGVHPLYLDKLSSEFAIKIENMPSYHENSSLMREMFRAYCHLVRAHSTRGFSPIVQKAILLIDSDMSADISLHSVADSLGVSAGYLSTAFKKSTGKTMSEYVREKRIKYAAYLLETTSLQIQTVALHCGILDVQYFSKLFKGYMKQTPTEYRLHHRRIQDEI